MTVENISKRDTAVTMNGRVIELGLPILEALEIKGLVVLVLNDFRLPSDDPNVGRNIVALDQDGNKVWRVQDFWHKVEVENDRKVPDSYTGIDIGEDGKLYAYQGIGYVCEIDLKTGKIIHEEQTR